MTDSALSNIQSKFNHSEQVFLSFRTIYDFLLSFPEYKVWRKKHPALDLNDATHIEIIYEKFINGKNFTLAYPKTKIDSAVKEVLINAYDFDSITIDDVLKNHQFAMLAENQIGDLLEKYLASKLEPLGWVWCSGSIVNKIDFIKKDDTNWRLLQIKNRATTENSSSSSVRNNTNIIKWYRLSNNGKSCWDKFPENQITGLDESDFLKFIREESLKLKV